MGGRGEGVRLTTTPPVSPEARAKALELHDFIANAQEPTVWTAQHMTAAEVLTSLLTVAGQFHQNQIDRETTLGALLTAAAWIAEHGEAKTSH